MISSDFTACWMTLVHFQSWPHLFSPLTRTQIRNDKRWSALLWAGFQAPCQTPQKIRNAFASTLAAIRLTVTGLDSGLCNPAGWKKGKGCCAGQVIVQWKLKDQRLTVSNYSRCLQNRNHQSVGCNMEYDQYDPRSADMWCHRRTAACRNSSFVTCGDSAE